MSIINAITLAVAVLGAVLGLINTCHALSRSRLKLRVTPANAIPIGSANPRINFSIEVTNLSEFAVTIREVGFSFYGTESRAVIRSPILLDGRPWPRRLEPRTSVRVFAVVPPKNENASAIRCAYARTECDRTRTGNSPALEQLAGRNPNVGFFGSLLFGR